MADFVDELIARLQSPDLKQRQRAVGLLGKLGDVRAVEPLIGAAADPDNGPLLNFIVQSLGHLRDERAIPFLIEQLHLTQRPSYTPLLGSSALRLLGALAIPPMRAALALAQEADFQVAIYETLFTLKALNAEDITPLVALATSNQPEHLQYRAIHILGSIPHPQSLTLFTTLQNSSSKLIRSAAQQMLANYERQQLATLPISQLVAKLQQLAQLTYTNEAPGRLKHQPIDDIVQELINRGPVAREALDALWAKANQATRRWAAIVLGHVGDARGQDLLVPALYDDTAYLGWRWRALRALGHLGDTSLLDNLHALLADKTKPYRLRSASEYAIAQLRDPRSIPVLVDIIVNDRSDLNLSASADLAHFGAPAIAPLTAVLHNSHLDYDIRFRALLALARVAEPAASAAIRPLLHDPDAHLREWAARKLGEMGATEAQPELERLRLTDEVEAVRDAAQMALYWLAKPQIKRPQPF